MLPTKENLLTKKWKYATVEDRPLGQRFVLAALPAFLLGATYFTFGAIELTAYNANNFNFTLSEVAWAYILVGIAVCSFLTLAVLLAGRGKILDFLVCALTGVAMASYIQGNFLNMSYGLLDGSRIPWETTTTYGMLNLLVWVVLIGLPFALRFLSRDVWRNVTLASCGILIGMQLVGATVTYASHLQKETFYYYLSEKEGFCLSKNENIVFFLLDATYTEVINDVMEAKPELAETFKDFTNFDNASTKYYGTFPAATYLLSGRPYDFDKSYHQYFENAWVGNTFIDDLHKAGYTNSLLLFDGYMIGNIQKGQVELIKRLEEQVDNFVAVDQGSRKIQYAKLVRQIEKLSFFRYVPHVMKPIFWSDGTGLNGLVGIEASDCFLYDDARFYANLSKKRLSDDAASKRLLLYYLHGVHNPYTLNERAERVSERETDAHRQALGVFFILEEYIEQLKAKGLYDNTTIVITADHGYIPHASVCFLVKPKGAQNEHMTVNSAPITHQELWPTIFDCIGLDYAKYGHSAFDMQEDGQVERSIFGYWKSNLYPANQTGMYNIMNEYRFSGDAKKYVWDPGTPADAVHPIPDSIW